MKALFKKAASPENANVAAELYTNLGKYITTNFSLTNLTRHLDIIFSFTQFDLKDVEYPGTIRKDANGDPYFDGDLNEAIRLLSEYR